MLANKLITKCQYLFVSFYLHFLKQNDSISANERFAGEMLALKDTFIGNAKTATKALSAAGAAAALTFTPLGSGALAQDGNASTTLQGCTPLYLNQSGRIASAGLSAHIYSQENVGAVGISIFPGQDLTMDGAHAAGTALVNAFIRNGIEAECFVHNEHGAQGSGFNFKIDGQSWSKDGPMNIVEASNIETLRGVAAEARTARALLASTPDSARDTLALNP